MNQSKTVKEIVAEWLKANGYDGLWNDAGECACEGYFLMECDESAAECEAGYLCPCDCGEHAYHISPEKPVAPVDEEPKP